MKIAISYRHADDSETLRLLVQALRSRFGEENVYLDTESSRIGELWPIRWGEAYISADCILVVIGRQWSPQRLQQSSDLVLLEVSGVGISGWERVVPVMIDGGALPERTQLPLRMRPILTRQGHVIDPEQPGQSIEHFVERLERDMQPPSGWHLKKMRARVQPTTSDLAGEWELQSSDPLFTNIHIQQNGKVLKFWALSAYGDEIVGDGFVAIGKPGVTFMLTSKRFGAAGILVLKHDANAATLTGRWMPPMRSLWISALFRKKVSFKRK